MSRFKNEVAHLQAHVKTLRLGAGALFVVALLLGFGWWSAPKSLTIHVPPDLRSGSTRKWWDVPPESVYAFSFYIWQQVQRWPTNGEEDYPRNLRALSAYLTPSCRAFLQQDYEYRRASGELRQRVRGIYEIPGRGYGDDPAARVRGVGERDWIVTLDVSADEYYGAEQVKRALVRYALKVVRHGHRPRAQPLRPGAGLLCTCAPAHRNPAAPGASRQARQPRRQSAGRHPMKRCFLPALAGVLLCLGFVPAGQAMEILRWERLPLAVPLVVGQERVVFIDRNVRIGVPAGVGEQLRVQSAGGAIYLRASEPIPPTRLQLQDVESGALILLDIAAEPAKAGQPRWNRCASSKAMCRPRSATASRPAPRPPRTTQASAWHQPPGAKRRWPSVLTRYAAQNLYAPLRTVEPAGIGRVNLRRDLALDTLLPTLPVRAGAGRVAARRPVGDGRALTNTRRAGSTSTRAPCRAISSPRPSSTRPWGRPARGPTPPWLYLVTRGHGLAESLLPASWPRSTPREPAAGRRRPGRRRRSAR
jgi:integrating conjugative element protein (TIGR03746 family)/integrating conjugative element protein (TIGR03749 family)